MNLRYPSFLFCLILASCSFFDKDEAIPSYIHIKKFQLNTTSAQGTNSNNITDAWVYVNGNSLGVFELPCTIPVLTSGNTRITLYAGIKRDGVSAIRVIYPFYTNYVSDFDLSPGMIDTISPTCTYFDPPLATINKEEFEDAGLKFSTDAMSTVDMVKTNISGEVFEGSYSGKMELTPSDLLAKSYYTVNFDFPGNGAEAYLELNYKNNVQFVIGLEITEPLNVVQTDNTVINPSYDENGNLIWKKIYCQFTELINLHPNATNYRIYIQAINPNAESGLFVLTDNFKVVYGE